MKLASDDTLRQAIDRRAVVLLSLSSAAGALCHYNTRLLASERDGFWIETPAGAASAIEASIAAVEQVGISFKAGESKIVFTTVIQRTGAPDGTGGDGLLIKWPVRLGFVQHRAEERVNVARDTDVPLRVWRISTGQDLRDEPAAASEWPAKLRDLGLGGMGLIAELLDDQGELAPGERLRVLLGGEGNRLILDGTVKTVRPLTARARRVSVRFEHLDEDLVKQQAIVALTQTIARLRPGGGARPARALRSA